MRILFILGLMASSLAFSDDHISQSPEPTDQVEESGIDYARLPRSWRKQSESTLSKAAKAPLRAALYPLIYSGGGRIAKRTAAGGQCALNLVGTLGSNNKEAALEKAGYVASDSLANPLGTLNDGVSDAITVIKSPLYAMSQLSHRIQLCTSNLASGLSRRLTAAHAINPANHIALYIDGGVYETQDPRATNDLSDASIKGGIHCTPVPILNGEPESIAIERLECVDKHFNTGYSFATYNCGGYTHDILKMAGLGVAAFENFGIGGEFASRNGKDMKESIRRTTEKCNQHIHSLRKAISTLESGKDATLELKTLESVFSSDARLQLIVSAARNKLQSNREWMEKNVTNSSVTSTPYFKDGRSGEMSTFKRGMKKHLEDIVGSIDEDGRVWIKQHYPYLDSEILQKISHQ